VNELVEIFFNEHIMRSAASLAYFLTISIFPLLLCIVAIPVNIDLAFGLRKS